MGMSVVVPGATGSGGAVMSWLCRYSSPDWVASVFTVYAGQYILSVTGSWPGLLAVSFPMFAFGTVILE
jgi:hypothetical protein